MALIAFLAGRSSRGSSLRSASDAGQVGTMVERLHTLGRQQESIGEALSELHSVLGNKQARGAFGEVQLQRLVADLLPIAAYRMQVPLGRNRVDCVIRMPWPPGPVPVDAKFPLEAYRRWLVETDDPQRATRALRALQRDFADHVDAIAQKYIVPGKTADFALMFLPSEAVFAALHAECRTAVEAAHRARVFPVSPSTLWPLLNTLGAVLREAEFAPENAALQAQARQLADDSARLADHARRLERDWSRMHADLQALITAADTLSAGGRAFAAAKPPA